MIVDAHVHLGAWRHPGFLGLEAHGAEIARELAAAGVGAVALTPSDEGDNRALLRAAATLPFPSWCFAWARPGEEGAAALGELCARARGELRGLKLHASLEAVPLDDPRWDPIFALADAEGLALMLHTGRWQAAAGYGLALARARAWPRVQLLLSHAGGDTPELCLGAAREVARERLENVCFDTAGLREHWALARAMAIAGAERYLMGSDFPLAHPAMYIAQIGAMAIPDAWKEGLLGANALRVLGPPRGGVAGERTAPPSVPELRARRTGTGVLVTGAGGPIGVNLTRSLRLARRPLRLIGTDANPYHRPLSLCDRTLAVPRAGSSGYREALAALCAEEEIAVIFPTHPAEVAALSALRDTLGARLFLPPHGTILLGNDKHASYERFVRAGVPAPRSRRVDAPADLEAAFAELGPGPLWLRGSGSPGAGIGVASLRCRSPEIGAAWVEHHEGWGRFMIAELLPGANLTWLGVFADDELVACQARERLEYVIPHVSPSGVTGAPAVSRTLRRPELRALGEAAVRALCDGHGPAHGVFFVDLTEDRAGAPRVTEVNCGRFGTTLHFYTAAGFNFPELALALALGERPAPVLDPIPPDLYWLRTLDCGPVLIRGSDLERG